MSLIICLLLSKIKSLLYSSTAINFLSYELFSTTNVEYSGNISSFQYGLDSYQLKTFSGFRGKVIDFLFDKYSFLNFSIDLNSGDPETLSSLFFFKVSIGRGAGGMNVIFFKTVSRGKTFF